MTDLRTGARAPASPFPVLPLRSGTLFPGATISLPVGRERSIALVTGHGVGSILGIALQKNSATDNPGPDDLHPIGTFARVQRIERARDRTFRIVLEGVGRMHLDRLVQQEPYWMAEGRVAEELRADSPEARLLARSLRTHLAELTQGTEQAVQITDADDPALVADQVAAALGLPIEREVELLHILDVPTRLARVAELLSEARALADLKRKIDHDVRKEVGKGQREAMLREQLKAIKREIGDDKDDDLSALRDKLDKAGLSDEARTVADRELRRLEGTNGQGAEAGVIRNYLELIADLPWTRSAKTNDDLDAMTAKLDADHDGLSDVKKRILEHMAVLKLSGNPRGTLLCLVGPPGVGKTSLGQSIADATGRPFVRISLGGVRDEAEIRGHRRTYVGAMAGRIVHALRKARVRNPVVLLDEVDKMTSGWGGSPEAALLEVLDPEQNKTFTDHYLEIPFDLSEVVFVCTANGLDGISGPLRDRLEIIEMSGYTLDEKLAIARNHLVPRQLQEHGITPDALVIGDGALRAIIRDYTREAGVRQLTREITKVCRSLALKVARASDTAMAAVQLEEGDLAAILGRTKYYSEVAERTSAPGVATGLAWTPVGGDILFIETSRMPGKGQLEITGQLGDVMKESARAALTYVRSNAGVLGVDPAFLSSQDLHIHVPAGGTPKDGPSALLTGQRVRSDTAMTGECTLRGKVMPVGGIKSKVLAAHRAGLTRVVLPARNARDLDDVPEEVRSRMEFIFADDMSQVLAAALEPVAPTGVIPRIEPLVTAHHA